MATLEELYGKVMADEAEGQAWARAQGEPDGVGAFLAAHGCDATPEQAAEFLRARLAPQGELADEELDSVAGGGCVESEPGYHCPACGEWELERNRAYHLCHPTCKNCGQRYWYGQNDNLSCPHCGETPR